jgi:hypothetical protein
MQGLMLHCGGVPATREQVFAVPTPERTDTYTPIPYAQIIRFALDRIENVLGYEIHSEAYGLNRDGDQFFGCISMRTHDDHGLAWGLRSSHDKSMTPASAFGDKVFVCDNMMFTSSGTVVMRKHTGNAFQEFTQRVDRQVSTALQTHEVLTAQLERMKTIPCHQDRGYEILGRARGRGILTARQSNVAFADWETPRHDTQDFTDRTLYALAQCFTEGLKKGRVDQALQRHGDAHTFLTQLMPAPPTIIEA